jgi:hypothetical protein|tara:strand:- start:78 stop:395 length:318 start_codon:yes stop_codon:yes gene_type:complete
MKTHELKTEPKYFGRLVSGDKTFEIRKNDRDFQVGDELILKEYDKEAHENEFQLFQVLAGGLSNKPLPEAKQGFTGEELHYEVTYLLGDFIGLADGYVAMGLKRL